MKLIGLICGPIRIDIVWYCNEMILDYNATKSITPKLVAFGTFDKYSAQICAKILINGS
jgi:hypothetical protein